MDRFWTRGLRALSPGRPPWLPRRYVPWWVGSTLCGAVGWIPAVRRRTWNRRLQRIQTAQAANVGYYPHGTSSTLTEDGVTTVIPNPVLDLRVGPVTFAGQIEPRRRRRSK